VRMRLLCYFVVRSVGPFVGASNGILKGMDGLDWTGRKGMCYYRFQSAWSFNGECEENRKSKRFCFLYYVGGLECDVFRNVNVVWLVRCEYTKILG
jgi:hypothetical protein